MHTALSDSMSEMFPNNFLSKKKGYKNWYVNIHSQKNDGFFIVAKDGVLAAPSNFSGFWDKKTAFK